MVAPLLALSLSPLCIPKAKAEEMQERRVAFPTYPGNPPVVGALLGWGNPSGFPWEIRRKKLTTQPTVHFHTLNGSDTGYFCVF